MNKTSSIWPLGILTLAVIGEITLAQEDPYLWLEEVEGERALDWARETSDRTLERLRSHELFGSIHEQSLEILNSDERLPTPVQMGGFVYNFWRDAEHVRGIWRRTSIEDFRQEAPDWETVLDLDRVAAEERENWVWSGAICLYPEYDRCLVSLSRGGGDAVVVREYDVLEKHFVTGGFELPEAKSDVAWRDRDSLFVGTDFGSGSLTSSGYPRFVKLWQRGTPLEEAETIFEGAVDDVASYGLRQWDGERYYDLVVQAPTFYTFNHFLLADDGEIRRLLLPDDADVAGIVGGQLLVELKSDWDRNGQTFIQGSLIAIDADAVTRGEGETHVLFEPDSRSSIASVRRTENRVILNILENVVSRIEILSLQGDEWQRSELDTPGLGSIGIVSTDLDSDRFYYGYTGFLTPPSLFEADAGTLEANEVKAQPDFFDATGMTVEQSMAVSADGTEIPYFIVKPRGFVANGANPTLLYGYGGFEISETPSYSATVGTAWLARGGTFVVANIRGGGEFGPSWHQAALKENRQRAYDDFIAVAEDLIARDITSPEHLGIQGGSNGGLLVGAVVVQRPDLFNAVVCSVPLLDMRRYHLLLAGASWMAEYGDPDKPEEWAYISEYSPYQNVSADAEYPEIYFFTSTRDDRVHPGHARKMVARMLDQGHEVLYYENTEGGHGGAANLLQRALNSALAYTYLHDKLN